MKRNLFRLSRELLIPAIIIFATCTRAENNFHKLIFEYQHDNQLITPEYYQASAVSIEFFNAGLGNIFNFIRFGVRTLQTDNLYYDKPYDFVEVMAGSRNTASIYSPYFGIGFLAGDGKECNFEIITQEHGNDCSFGKNEVAANLELGLHLPVNNYFKFALFARGIKFLREDNEIYGYGFSINVLF